ncbi:MAG: prolyl oligopeptidase family serine peptidase, partial [Solirubrobacterales bacterium]
MNENMGTKLRCLLSLLTFIPLSQAAPADTVDAPPFAGTKSSFYNYNRYDFTYDGRACIVVTPKTAAEGKPWIWRARFFGHEPQTDIALLERGYHLVYIDAPELYGSPKAVELWDHFYAYLTRTYGFAPRAVLEGMSRGGLYIYNWAAKNPDKVCCIYADAPVCDIKSWPGGKGVGPGSAECWAEVLKAYEMTEDQAMKAKCNPIDNLEPLARAGIPLLHVVGDADEVVPLAENTTVLEGRYKALGGSIQVIHKPGVGHHPHSLRDPAPIVDFILTSARRWSQREGAGELLRERIEWCDIWITNADKNDLPRVLLIGDSITRGYFGEVEQTLAGKANCARLTTSRCICDPVFFDELLMMLRQYRFAVIHFNNGLHGMGYTQAQYRQGFAKLMAVLQEHGQGARLIWAATTPVRKRGALSELDGTTEIVEERNRIAADFAARAGVPTDNLFDLGTGHPEYYSD